MEDETLEKRQCLNVDDIIRLLRMCLDATYLSFRDTHYRPTFGTAMGSPVLVTVANLVNQEPGLIHLYSSPTFLEMLHQRHVHSDPLLSGHTIPRSLGVNKHIRLTLEMKEDNSLPFLDVLLHHRDRSIHTTLYRKPTHTDCYLDLDFSHHPLEHERSVVTTLFSHANSLMSMMLQRMKNRISPIS